MAEMKLKPEIRFAGFTDAWGQRKLGDVLKTHSFKPYLAMPKVGGRFEIIQQGDNPVIGYSDGIPFEGFEPITLFGDHTVSLYKPDKPFFVATDGIKILSAENISGRFLYTLLERYKPIPQGYKRHYTILASEFAWVTYNDAEQRRIGTFFASLDNLITLHQREYDKIVNMKKALLGKMFPKEGANRPEIRFAGFTDAWEQRKLGDLFAPIPNNTLSRAALNYNGGAIRSIHYGDILIKYGAIADCKKDVIPFIAEGEEFDYRNQLLQDGDVLFADAAEDKTVGKAIEIKGVGDDCIVSGQHTIACRPLIKMQPNYLGYYLNSPSFHDQLRPLMQGIKVLSISRTNLAKTTVLYPSSEREQSGIGQLFSALDNLITLHQREHCDKKLIH